MNRIHSGSASETASSVAHALLKREKPSANSPVKWIVGGSVTGAVLLAVLGFAFWFHFKRRSRDRLERDKELQEMDDYGLGDYSNGGRVDDDVAWPQRGESMKPSGRGPHGGAAGARPGSSD